MFMQRKNWRKVMKELDNEIRYGSKDLPRLIACQKYDRIQFIIKSYNKPQSINLATDLFNLQLLI